MAKNDILYQSRYLRAYLKRGGSQERWLDSKDFLEADQHRILEQEKMKRQEEGWRGE